MSNMSILIRVVLLGAGATMVMDLWILVLRRMGVQTQNFALVGRWTAHLFRGQFFHDPIASSDSVPGELALGWLVHYAVGIGFAASLVGIAGVSWINQPSVIEALAFGVATVLVPFLLMQPAMGQGIAAARTPKPYQHRLRSLANHAVFGLGLYVSAVVIAVL